MNVQRKAGREEDKERYTYNNDEMRRRHMLGPPAGNLNTITPCAACKLLRRRCAQECPFSPYFSPNEPQKFASVHKVFGASNVSKLLMEVPENQRADAVNSLVYEAKVRLRDPVYGCMGAISALQQQIHSLKAELNAVRCEIMRFKYRDNSSININNSRRLADLLSSEAVSIVAPPQHSTTPSSSSSIYTTNPIPSAEYSSTITDDNVSYFV